VAASTSAARPMAAQNEGELAPVARRRGEGAETAERQGRIRSPAQIGPTRQIVAQANVSSRTFYC
jgi:hypothetical protein